MEGIIVESVKSDTGLSVRYVENKGNLIVYRHVPAIPPKGLTKDFINKNCIFDFVGDDLVQIKNYYE